jgi:hypothetical protein
MKTLLPLILAGLALLACAGGPRSTGPGAGAGIGVTPASVDFGDTPVGCLRKRSVEVENTGRRAPVSVRMSSSDDAFRPARGAPLAVPPGETRAVELLFAPEGPGAREAVFTFQNAAAPRRPVRLRASGGGIQVPPSPLDLVLVVDVSTTMTGIPRLRAALGTILARVEARGLDVRFGLTTFENDVVVHRRGAFLEPEALLAELDSQLLPGAWTPDPDVPRQLLNFEPEENVLDALHRSAVDFPFRPGARHALFLVTDDTFLEPPAVFSDGTPVLRSYAEVADALAAADATLFSVHVAARGRGLSAEYRGRPSLVEQTGGTWRDLSHLRAGAFEEMLGAVLERPDCREAPDAPAARAASGP